jgi:hypothetical protein
MKIIAKGITVEGDVKNYEESTSHEEGMAELTFTFMNGWVLTVPRVPVTMARAVMATGYQSISTAIIDFTTNNKRKQPGIYLGN